MCDTWNFSTVIESRKLCGKLFNMSLKHACFAETGKVSVQWASRRDLPTSEQPSLPFSKTGQHSSSLSTTWVDDKICLLQLFSHRMLVVRKVRRKLNGWRSPLRPGSTKTKTWNLMRCESLTSSYTNFQMFNRWKSFWAISLRQNFNCR